MILKNLNIVGSEGLNDILIGKEKITAIGVADGYSTGLSLDFQGALVFPGLINSHDHLDFNLFPRLGNRVYANYNEWGPDIQKQNRQEIDAVLKIPQALRTRWGIYKNLLNGVTTVVNHGERLATDGAAAGHAAAGPGQQEELIDVFQHCHCLHSVGFEKNWKWKLNRPYAGAAPFVLHVGEGTDEAAGREIDRLIRWNLFKKPLIGVHGVAMSEEQANHFKALVWCPVTNYFLLGRTADVDRLKRQVPILFGTDSTLTAEWNIWEHLRVARKGLTDTELLDTLTKNPAAVWGLKDRGELAAGQIADLVIARPRNDLYGMDAFFSLDPKDILLVLSKGRIRLFDPSLLDPLRAAGLDMNDFHQAGVDGKYVKGDLPGLVKAIKDYYPSAAFPFKVD
jgi:cytosine/adenosine deaminase-related metal-dependent hydrolase